MRVLVVNSGSKSVKLRLVGDDDQVLTGADLGPPDRGPVDQSAFVADAGGVDAVGDRVVHGAAASPNPSCSPTGWRDLEALSELAPLHNPPALAGIDTPAGCSRKRLRWRASTPPFTPTSRPPSAYAFPAEWVTRWGIRGSGSHGLSCAWAAAGLRPSSPGATTRSGWSCATSAAERRSPP